MLTRKGDSIFRFRGLNRLDTAFWMVKLVFSAQLWGAPLRRVKGMSLTAAACWIVRVDSLYTTFTVKPGDR
jgi:hypothetical protein